MKIHFIKPSLAGILITFLSATFCQASMLRVNDELGREVIFSFPPQRIVSLAPNVTEILFSLGLDRKIVGDTIHCNFPPQAKTKARVGSYISLDFEKIVSLHPDLIIATGAGNTRDMVERLEKLGLPTYVIYPKNFDDIFKNIEHVGQIVNRKKEAKEIITQMKERRQRVVDLTRHHSRPKVFIQVGEAPMITVGKGSFADDLIRLAGGENITGDENKEYPQIGMEEILKRAPEVIVVSSMNPNGDYQKVLHEWSRWKTIPAIKNNRLYLINSDLIDRPSPRIIAGLEELAKDIHPEIFKN